MTLRYIADNNAEFLLLDPEPVETNLSGPVLRVPEYVHIHRDGRREVIPYCGDFPLSRAILIEPVPEQFELRLAEAA